VHGEFKRLNFPLTAHDREPSSPPFLTTVTLSEEAIASLRENQRNHQWRWVVAGPNEVQPEDEAEAQHLLRPSDKPK
jgi:hypothetical protein